MALATNIPDEPTPKNPTVAPVPSAPAKPTTPTPGGPVTHTGGNTFRRGHSRVPITYTHHPARRRRRNGITQRFAPPPPSGIRVRGRPTTIIGIAKPFPPGASRTTVLGVRLRGGPLPTRVAPARSPGG